MDRHLRPRGPILFLLVGLSLAACTGGGATGASTGPATTASPPAAATTIAVTLQEWAVVPASTSAKAGSLTFEVANSGPNDVHEFVILKTDLDASALPVDETGKVSEDGAGIEVVDEVEGLAVGATGNVTATLAAGHYVLLCNIYAADEKEAHYRLGMRTNFTVTN